MMASLEILVTNVSESIKWSESQQLVGYIFECYTALASSLPLLVGYAVQSLLAVLLCQLPSILVRHKQNRFYFP